MLRDRAYPVRHSHWQDANRAAQTTDFHDAMIEALRKQRPNVGAATPDFIQDAAIAAWNDDAHTGEQRCHCRVVVIVPGPVNVPAVLVSSAPDTVRPAATMYNAGNTGYPKARYGRSISGRVRRSTNNPTIVRT